ncbi:MAG: hypothetical protein EYC70_11010 [Planctomycetota bacterium]|nr:MAG: hypothetical protein EYC70_11010 [Planctomycetota bacterium]
MKEVLALLVQVQRLDERLSALQRRLDSLPVELAEHAARSQALDAEAQALESQRRAALVQAQALETDVRTHEKRLQKVESQARELRDAGAVQVFQHEAQELRDKISRAEEEALALIERAENLVPERDQAGARARAAAAALEQFRAAVAADQAELGAQREALAREHDALLARLPEETATLYAQLARGTRKGHALSPLRGSSCGACGMVMPPNDRLRVQAMSEVARCRSCGRILVAPELWDAQAAGTGPQA